MSVPLSHVTRMQVASILMEVTRVYVMMDTLVMVRCVNVRHWIFMNIISKILLLQGAIRNGSGIANVQISV